MSSEKTLKEIIQEEECPLIKAQFLNHYFRKLEKGKGTSEQYKFASQQYLILHEFFKDTKPELADSFSNMMIYCENMSKV
jgi:hypothetical protein